MNKLIALLACVTATGCVSVTTAQRLTSGTTGCRAQEINISNFKQPGLSPSTWEAACKGKTYICTLSVTAQCTEAR